MKLIIQTALVLSLCVGGLFLTACGHKSYFQSAKSSLVEEETAEKETSTDITEEEQTVSKQQDSSSSSHCYVQVAGAVNKPGVFEMSENGRVFQAIEKAGGLREDADVASLNQALVISDGMMIYVYTQSEIQEQKKAQQTESSKVNLNQADAKELMTLSGIGESKAKLILDYRSQHGSFTKIEDLMKISGIKEGVYNKIKDNITV